MRQMSASILHTHEKLKNNSSGPSSIIQSGRQHAARRETVSKLSGKIAGRSERADRKSPRARTRCTPRSRSLAARARRRDPGRRPGEVVEALSCCSRKQMMRPNTALPRHCPCRTSHCRWTLLGARPGAGPGRYVPK